MSQAVLVRAATIEEVRHLVSSGRWQLAREEIQGELAEPDVDFQTRQDLRFQSDRMSRIRLDFDKTRQQVFQEARDIVPGLEEAAFDRWVKAGFVESMDIDGTRRYFHRAAGNLFRLCPEARALDAHRSQRSEPALWYRLEDIRNVLARYDATGRHLLTPKHWSVTYSLRVNPDAVPDGELVRAWLPFAHDGIRQEDIRLISSDPPSHVQSGTTGTLACVYLEKPAMAGQPTEFKICYEFTTSAFYQPIDPAKVRPVSVNDFNLAPFLAEQPPHIEFSDEVKRLSREITGSETNLYFKARLIFQWVCRNIPWAGAREYSTLDSLSHYALAHRHGDCGIQTMLFMTLCRLNGIPARWESGWMMGPVKTLHDWCEIYLAPYGWVPVDVSYGLVDSEQEREKWFYLGNVDGLRLIVNTDYQQAVYPEKIFPRSEIVDFQRGEVEWRGGNLYFNQWKWNFNVREVSAPPATGLERPAVSR